MSYQHSKRRISAKKAYWEIKKRIKKGLVLLRRITSPMFRKTTFAGVPCQSSCRAHCHPPEEQSRHRPPSVWGKEHHPDTLSRTGRSRCSDQGQWWQYRLHSWWRPRDPRKVFHEEAVKTAEFHEWGLLSTLELFNAFLMLEKEEITKETVVKGICNQTGQIKFLNPEKIRGSNDKSEI